MLSTMHALIIEPNPLNQAIFSHVLEDSAFQVAWAQTGREALNLTRQQDFDVICMSMHLLDLNAPQLCMRFRAMDKTLHTPIVMLTSTDDDNIFQDALVAGATEIFHKNEISQFGIYLEQLKNRRLKDHTVYGKILYIEPQQNLANETSALLHEAGYDVLHFQKAQDALRVFKQQPFDLVLTDLMLEDNKSSQNMIREILQMPGRHSEVPILAMSGLNDARRRVELLHSGVSDYIQKPVLDEELLARVKNLIRMRHLLDQVEKQRAHMRELAMLDQLTHLYNRHFLMDMGPRKISEAIRHNISLSLLMIDVDHFKTINDTYGHSSGDRVLEKIADVLNASCRNEDIAARFGGEEFVVILMHCNQDDALNKAEQIRSQIAAIPFDHYAVTASLGVACLDAGNACDFKTLFELADAALYKAKQGGRNRVELASPELKVSNLD